MVVVDLVRAGVQQVFALEVNFSPAKFPGQPFGEVEGRGPAAEFPQVIIKFTPESRVFPGTPVLALQFLQRMNECLRHETPSVRTEMASVVGQIFCGN